MPQIQLPVFPEGVTPINQDLAIHRENGKVVYLHGLLPVFQHDEGDVKSFRLITSQLIANGTARQKDIVRAFGVPLATVKRYMKVHREQGSAGFFRPRKTRGATVLNPEVKQQVQALLDEGKDNSEVSRTLAVKGDTLRKAINSGRLRALKKRQ